MENGDGKHVLEAIELPRHLRMVRLEARRFIEEYSKNSDRNSYLLELAKLEYNKVQALHQSELAEVTRFLSNTLRAFLALAHCMKSMLIKATLVN